MYRVNDLVIYDSSEREMIEGYITDQFDDGDSGAIYHEIQSEYVHSDVFSGVCDGVMKYCTCGMSAREMNGVPQGRPKRIELYMYAEDISNDDSKVNERMTISNQLVSLSKIPFREDCWLGHCHTADARDDFKNIFGYDGFIILASDESLRVKGIGNIEFMLVFPLYRDEMEWLWKNSDKLGVFIEELLDWYDEHDAAIGVVDRKRNHIIPEV